MPQALAPLPRRYHQTTRRLKSVASLLEALDRIGVRIKAAEGDEAQPVEARPIDLVTAPDA